MTAGGPELQARLDGQMAALNGKPVTTNPHPLGTVTSRAWARGHRQIVENRP